MQAAAIIMTLGSAIPVPPASLSASKPSANMASFAQAFAEKMSVAQPPSTKPEITTPVAVQVSPNANSATPATRNASKKVVAAPNAPNPQAPQIDVTPLANLAVPIPADVPNFPVDAPQTPSSNTASENSGATAIAAPAAMPSTIPVAQLNQAPASTATRQNLASPQTASMTDEAELAAPIPQMPLPTQTAPIQESLPDDSAASLIAQAPTSAQDTQPSTNSVPLKANATVAAVTPETLPALNADAASVPAISSSSAPSATPAPAPATPTLVSPPPTPSTSATKPRIAAVPNPLPIELPEPTVSSAQPSLSHVVSSAAKPTVTSPLHSATQAHPAGPKIAVPTSQPLNATISKVTVNSAPTPAAKPPQPPTAADNNGAANQRDNSEQKPANSQPAQNTDSDKPSSSEAAPATDSKTSNATPPAASPEPATTTPANASAPAVSPSSTAVTPQSASVATNSVPTPAAISPSLESSTAKPTTLVDSPADATPHSLQNPSVADAPGTPGVTSAQIAGNNAQCEIHVAMQADKLGSVELRARVTGEQVGAAIVVDKKEAHTALAVELPTLRQALAEKNFRVEHVWLTHSSLHSAAGDAGNSADQRPRSSASTSLRNVSQKEEASPTLSAFPAEGSSGIYDDQGHLSVRV